MRIREVIIVEGKYDKMAVKRSVDATVLETSGFGIFSDKKKLALIEKMAANRGIIVLTDSDSAGFVIRNYLKGTIKGTIKQAYIPEITGKEKRKTEPSKENRLGVEGMKSCVIKEALIRAGATAVDFEEENKKDGEISKTDMYKLGLSGRKDSLAKRNDLLSRLDLPKRMSSNAMLDVLNALFSKEDLYDFIETSSMHTVSEVEMDITSQTSETC